MARRLLRALALAALVAAGGTLLARTFGYRLGPNTVVRCRRGHLSTTSWIPGVKLKGLDLGLARLQRCPVSDGQNENGNGRSGGHWSLVTPVRPRDLTDDERRQARAHHDVPIP
jgi:hypothetical protein